MSQSDPLLLFRASLAPVVALAAIGQWLALLIRLDGVAVAAWLLTLSLAGSRIADVTGR
jgi:hypothetical protein